MPDRYVVVGVTGQRPQHLRPRERDFLRRELPRVLGKLHTTVRADNAWPAMANGMALGVDQLAAESALQLDWPVDAYLPFPKEHQQRLWGVDDRARYEELLGRCRRIDVFSTQFHFGAYHLRNQRIVDVSDIMIVATNGRRSGGTWDCVQRIVAAGKPSILIHLAEQRTSKVSAEALALRLGLDRKELAS